MCYSVTFVFELMQDSDDYTVLYASSISHGNGHCYLWSCNYAVYYQNF